MIDYILYNMEKILNDPQLLELEEIVIGSWGESWEESCQALIGASVKDVIVTWHILILRIYRNSSILVRKRLAG